MRSRTPIGEEKNKSSHTKEVWNEVINHPDWNNFCECGCGQKVRLRFVSGHNSWQKKIFSIDGVDFRECLKCGRVLELQANFSPNSGKKKKKYNARCKDCVRLQRYGITFDVLQRLYDVQNGLCAICGDSKTLRDVYIDHNHETGEVRGLLCPACNTAIGLLQENLQRFQGALKYLGL